MYAGSALDRSLSSPIVKAGPAAKTYDSTPHLYKKPEFEAALHNYHMSSAAEKVLRATPYVTMTGPTSTGRNTIIRELLKTGHYYFIISDTTRPPRYNDGVLEQNGVEYFFRSEEEVLADIKAGRYIEAEIIHDQQVSGQSIREVEKAHAHGKIALSDIEILGSVYTAGVKPETTSILLLPPSFDEWLYRIQKRTPLKPIELYRRLQQATKIFKTALATDLFVFVVNDDFHEAVKTVDEIARLGVHHRDTEAASRQLAQKLHQQTIQFLQHHAPGIPVY